MGSTDTSALRSLQTFLFVMILIASTVVGAGSVTAAGGSSDENADVTQIGSQHIVISDVEATVGGVDVEAAGLPSVNISERTYGVDHATISIDGVHMEWDGHTYQICQIDVVLNDISVTLQDVTVN